MNGKGEFDTYLSDSSIYEEFCTYVFYDFLVSPLREG